MLENTEQKSDVIIEEPVVEEPVVEVQEEEPIDVHKVPQRPDSQGIFCTSNPDIKFTVKGGGREWETQVIYKDKLIFPIIPSAIKPTKIKAERDRELARNLVDHCGFDKAEAKKIVGELPGVIAEQDAERKKVYDKWQEVHAKLEVEEHLKKQAEKPKNYHITIDKNVVGGSTAEFTYGFDKEKKLFYVVLSIDDEIITDIDFSAPQHFWAPESTMKLEFVKFLHDKYGATRDTATAMLMEFFEASKAIIDDVRRLNPKETWLLDIEKEHDQFLNSNTEAGLTKFGKLTYYGCIVPPAHKVDKFCNYRVEKKIDKEGESYDVDVPISQMPIMITGLFTSDEGIDHVEITLTDGDKKRIIYVPLSAVLGSREFKEILRPKSVRINDNELPRMLDFFNTCISANLESGSGTKFRQGECHHHTGYTDASCQKFVAGHFILSWDGKEVVQEECVYTDEITVNICDPHGTVEGYKAGVEPIMKYDRVRFVMYVAAAALVLKWLGITSFIFDLYGGVKGAENDMSGSGKTTMGVCAISLFGNANPKHGESLFHTCNSTENYVEGALTILSDLPVFLDESTNMKPEEKEKLVYRISNRVSKGRAKKTQGIQKTHAKTNTVITSGEHPLIPDEGNIGAQVRSLSLEGGIGVGGIRELVRAAEAAANANCGHLLIPFLHEFWLNQSGLKAYFEAAEQRYVKTTTNPMSQRQASYFAVVETAGFLMERAFKAVGIDSKDATEVAKSIWYETTHENPINSYWKESLEMTMQWITVNEEKHFQLPETVRDVYDQTYEVGANTELYGWRATAKSDDGESEGVINIIPLQLREFFKKQNRDYTTTMKSWMELDLVNWSIVNGKKTPTTVADKRGKSTRVIQLREKKVMDKLHDDW